MGWAKQVVLAFMTIVLILAAGLWTAARRSGAGRNQIVVEINKPPLDVFLWLLEPEKLKQWVAGLTQVTQLTPGAVTVGTKSRDVLQIGSETTVLNIEITALEPGRLLTARVDAELFTNVVRYELSDENGKTRLAYSAITNYKNGFMVIRELAQLQNAISSDSHDLSDLLKIGTAATSGETSFLAVDRGGQTFAEHLRKRQGLPPPRPSSLLARSQAELLDADDAYRASLSTQLQRVLGELARRRDASDWADPTRTVDGKAPVSYQLLDF